MSKPAKKKKKYELEVLGWEGTDITGVELVDSKKKTITLQAFPPKLGGHFCYYTDLAAGTYKLRVMLKNRPTRVFTVKISKKRGTNLTFAKPAPRCCKVQRYRSRFVGWDRITTQLDFDLGKKHEEVVLVAAYEYNPSKGLNFRRAAESRRDDLSSGYTYISSPIKTVVKEVQTKTGKKKVTKAKTVKLVKTKIPKERRIWWSTQVTILDVTEGYAIGMVKGTRGWHITERTKLGESPKKMSKASALGATEIYSHIDYLGQVAPGSIKELSIFSHSYSRGPILVDTDEEPQFKPPHGSKKHLRDPLDRDLRAKDFTHPKNLKPAEAKFVKAAFAKNAYIKIWGCFASLYYHKMLFGAARAKADSEKVTYVEYDKVTKTRRVLTHKVSVIKPFFKKQFVKGGYAASMAAFLGIRVWGAPPGMGSWVKISGRRYYQFVPKVRSGNTTILKFIAKEYGRKADSSNYVPYGK